MDLRLQELPASITVDDLNLHLVGIMGSHLYRIDTPASDLDLAGFYSFPKELYYGILKNEYYLRNDDAIYITKGLFDNNYPKVDYQIWDVKSFAINCLRMKYDIMVVLFSSDNNVLFESKGGKLFRENRKEFLNLSGMRKFDRYIKESIEAFRLPVGWKNKAAREAIRILHAGIEILETGDWHSETNDAVTGLFLDIHNDRVSDLQIESEIFDLKKRYDYARKNTSLRDEPNIEAINDLVVSVIRDS